MIKREKIIEIEGVKEKAAESDKRISAFHANMSHAIRTPVNILLNHLIEKHL